MWATLHILKRSRQMHMRKNLSLGLLEYIIMQNLVLTTYILSYPKKNILKSASFDVMQTVFFVFTCKFGCINKTNCGPLMSNPAANICDTTLLVSQLEWCGAFGTTEIIVIYIWAYLLFYKDNYFFQYKYWKLNPSHYCISVSAVSSVFESICPYFRWPGEIGVCITITNLL